MVKILDKQLHYSLPQTFKSFLTRAAWMKGFESFNMASKIRQLLSIVLWVFIHRKRMLYARIIVPLSSSLELRLGYNC